MPRASDEKWFFDTYAPRLSFDAMQSWSIRQQIEAYDELDVIAEHTTDNVMRSACLGVLTSRPDIAVLSKLGCKEDGDEFLALFDNEYAEGVHGPDSAVLLLDACRTVERARMHDRRQSLMSIWAATHLQQDTGDIEILWFTGHGTSSDGPVLA
ncbi:hypothetical protein [Methylorubrum zatmanii]